MTDYLAQKYLRPRKIPNTACSGCGLGQLHKAVVKAIDELGLGVEDVIWGTSIGCTGRQTFATWKGDSFAGTHGRVYAMATGLRLGLPPDKRILLTVGDGDAFGIGLHHLLNAARRNVAMTVVVGDNLGYQSTGGQYSWSTPEGAVTDSSPYGMREPNWIQDGRDILAMLREAGATFLARHTSLEGEALAETVRRALLNNGFSLIHVPFPCVTNFGGTALGSREPVEMFRWMMGQIGTLWKTGVFHDSSNSRREFSELMRDTPAAVRSGGVSHG